MKLLIISGTAHFETAGKVVGWGPAIEEIDHLASLFSSVAHIAPLHSGEAPAVMSTYANGAVRLVPVKPAGGPGLPGKINVLLRMPGYLRTMLPHLNDADAVHVRCPSNIGLLAIVLLALVRAPRLRWIKYAGEWRPSAPEAASYRLQRWWLRRGFSRGFVTVNGVWRGQPAHVHSFLNPSLTNTRLSRGRACLATKQLTAPLQLLFAGRLSESKGAGRAIEVLARVLDAGFAAELDIAGGGPERPHLESLAASLDLSRAVRFHGWLGRDELDRLYATTHFLVLPSESEGWPKVLSEAMAFGAVPLAGESGGIPHVLGECGSGRCLPHSDLAAFAAAVTSYARAPESWKRDSLIAASAAEAFTYEQYLVAASEMLGLGHRARPAASLLEAEAVAAGAAPVLSPDPSAGWYAR